MNEIEGYRGKLVTEIRKIYHRREKRQVRACSNCGYRQYYRKGSQTWRCDRCGLISGKLHYTPLHKRLNIKGE